MWKKVTLAVLALLLVVLVAAEVIARPDGREHVAISGTVDVTGLGGLGRFDIINTGAGDLIVQFYYTATLVSDKNVYVPAGVAAPTQYFTNSRPDGYRLIVTGTTTAYTNFDQ